MLRLLAILLFGIVTTKASSQQKTSNEIIAEGGAKMKVRPDIATFTLTIEKNDTIERNAIKALNLQTDELIKSLSKIGFTNKNIKISDYDISSSTNDEHKKRYTASNVLKVEFGIENKLIDAFYSEVQQSQIEDLDIAFDTKVSDSLEKATRLRLVQLAIEDAKTNANNISNALGIKIIKVKQVQKYAEALFDKNKIEIVKFAPPEIVRDTEIKYSTIFDKFQVEDVELEEKITVVYEIPK